MKKYHDDIDELLHPFWLGLIMLFTVTIIVGMMCFLRKRFGSSICQLCDRLRCRKKLDYKHHLKANQHLTTINPYNWAPVYAPPSSQSPKFYKLIRNIQMNSLDKESPPRSTENNENSMENDIFSITNESDLVKTPSPELHGDRSCETARKFYASMRYTSQCQNSSSLESHSATPTNRLTKMKLKLFRTPRFFQSITNRQDQE